MKTEHYRTVQVTDESLKFRGLSELSDTKEESMTMKLVDRIIDYENGELDHEDTVQLFQDLVDTGMAWTLQGHYGRTAAALIEAGYVTTALTETT